MKRVIFVLAALVALAGPMSFGGGHAAAAPARADTVAAGQAVVPVHSARWYYARRAYRPYGYGYRPYGYGYRPYGYGYRRYGFYRPRPVYRRYGFYGRPRPFRGYYGRRFY